MNDVLNLSGSKLGNYRLERTIGRGRMGVVYAARDEALLRPTAVKILSWQSKDRNGQNPEAWFLAEARSVARVNHPNVVQIYSVARQGHHCYIAMEYVSGGSAFAIIEKNGPFTPLRATEILFETAAALKAAHDAGIVHRDVKPENLLIGADGRPKLGDFGMALQISTPRPKAPARAGTPFYTAPEIWSGQAATPKTDLYALGATYFFLLTGRVPFNASDLGALIAAHSNAPIPLASALDGRIPNQCDRIIQQCLAKSPKERFADALALGVAAEQLLLSLRPEAPLRRRSQSWVETEFRNPGIELLDEAEPSQPWYSNQLLQVQYAALSSWLSAEPAHTMVLLGEQGSGRTTLASQLLKHHAGEGVALHFDGTKLRTMRRSAELLKRTNPIELARVADNGQWALTYVASIGHYLDSPALIVLDTDTASLSWYEKLADLMREVNPPKRSKVLVIGDIEQRQLWEIVIQGAAGDMILDEVPRLSFEQALSYIEFCVEVARTAVAPGLLVTPDASLLIAHRSAGNLGLLNHLVRATLEQVRADRTLTISSWHAWAAQPNFNADDLTDSAPDRITRPESWPSKPVLEILNRYRSSFGIPPRR